MDNQQAQPTIIHTEPGYPPAALPTIFVDGVVNAAPGLGVVKFYLFRSDPEMAGAPSFKNQVFAQVVMPAASFIATTLFFSEVLKDFTDTKALPEDLVRDITERITKEAEARRAARK